MEPLPTNPPEAQSEEAKLKIYFLPNLFTAGNLFCGFLALTRIVEAGTTAPEKFNYDIRQALFFILLACIFDLLDGPHGRTRKPVRP
jgi:CDP-diacylglycerol--serine O-phosphatidyltransferase